jgi:hypothetical protein
LGAQLIKLIGQLLVLPRELAEALLQLLDVETHLPDFLRILRRRGGGQAEQGNEDCGQTHHVRAPEVGF